MQFHTLKLLDLYIILLPSLIIFRLNYFVQNISSTSWKIFSKSQHIFCVNISLFIIQLVEIIHF